MNYGTKKSLQHLRKLSDTIEIGLPEFRCLARIITQPETRTK